MAQLVTGIELNDKECRLVQLRLHKAGASLWRTLRVEFPDDMPEEASERIEIKADLLKNALRGERWKISQAVITLPKHVVTVRYVLLPSTDDQELIQMARFEAERHIPFNAPRHIVSYHVMLKEGIAGSHTLLAAADGPIVEETIQTVTRAGVEIEALDVSSLALFNAFATIEAETSDGEAVALLNLGRLTADIVIISNGMLKSTRSIMVGVDRLVQDLRDLYRNEEELRFENLKGLDVLALEDSIGEILPPPLSGTWAGHRETTDTTEAQTESVPSPRSDEEEGPAERVRAWLSRMLMEIRRSYDSARREFDCPPLGRLYVSGEAVKLKNLDQFLSENLNLDVRPLSPLGNVKDARKGQTEDQEPPANYTVAFGAAARAFHPDSLRVSLLSNQYVSQRRSRRRRVSLASTVFLAVATLLLGGFYWHERSSMIQSELQEYREIIRTHEREVRQLEDKKTQLDIIESYQNDPRSALAILDRISSYAYIPNNVAMVEFVYRHGDNVEIYGHALSLKDLNTFVGDLEETGFFESVVQKQRHSATLHGRSQMVYSFELICKFPTPKEKRR